MGKLKGTTKSKGCKEDLDKFYTKPSVAKQCISYLNLDEYDIIVEPSAGNGSFSNQIDGCLAYDIKPEKEGIIEQDFFKLDTWQFYNKKVLTIGNPPFGKQNNLAIGFFNKAAEYSDTIAFIIPKTFMKSSVQSKLDKYFHLEKNVILDKNSFLLEGEDFDVNCVFQIWKKKSQIREDVIYDLKNDYIEFVNKEDCDFIIRRVGGNAGIAFNTKEGSTQSNYFVKNISGKTNEELIDFINTIDRSIVECSVGPRSISKGELVYEIKKRRN